MGQGLFILPERVVAHTCPVVVDRETSSRVRYYGVIQAFERELQESIDNRFLLVVLPPAHLIVVEGVDCRGKIEEGTFVLAHEEESPSPVRQRLSILRVTLACK